MRISSQKAAGSRPGGETGVGNRGASRLLAALALVLLAAPASAEFDNPTLLYQNPTADVLPTGALAVSADLTYPLVNTPKNVNYLETDVNVRFSPFRHLDFALTGYTFADYALDVKYRLLGGQSDRFGLALGVYDIGLTNYISSVGHDTTHVWPDWRYNRYLPRYDRPSERFSAYLVTSFPVTEFVRVHVGLGRGRFVGYDEHSKFLNIDYFFDEYHEWAFGLFGGVEFFVTPKVALVAEASGRDLNAGVKFNFYAFTADVSWTKMEGLLFDKGDARFGRLQVGLRYQFDNLSGLSRLVPRRTEVVWPKEVPPPPPPETIPTPVPPPPSPSPSPKELKLEPIWFRWDKWDITPEAEATLRRNADVLLANPEVKVVLAGYASEEGTLAHNDMLSGRRAKAAFEYLESLGVPAEQMHFRAMGESAGLPYSLHRAVYFEIEPQK